MNPLRILYIGPDYPGSNGTCWRNAFVELGHDVRTIDENRYVPPPGGLLARARKRFTGRPPVDHVQSFNRAIVNSAREFRPALTFYIKAYYVLPETLEETRKHGLNFAYMNDDMFRPGVRTFTFFENIKRMDCILTTKSFSVREYLAAGAPAAIYIPNAYDPNIHYPAQPSREEFLRYQGDVAFIGYFSPSKADTLAEAARLGSELRLNVWGGRWGNLSRIDHWPENRRWRALSRCIRGPELWCGDMGKAILSNRIILGLLCREVRDLHTSRTFEIPACGGFMLAERTEEHRMYFEEDKEAVYFSSTQELIDKIWFYLAHEDLRDRIAEAGYRRCIESRARYADRALFAVQQYAHMRRKSFRIPRPPTVLAEGNLA
jgi:glycosyltransferase involved in cell wall biosynthesis